MNGTGKHSLNDLANMKIAFFGDRITIMLSSQPDPMNEKTEGDTVQHYLVYKNVSIDAKVTYFYQYFKKKRKETQPQAPPDDRCPPAL